MTRRVALLACAAAGIVAVSGASAGGAEAGLLGALRAIGQSRPAAALREIERVIEERPNFRLAHLIRGDLLLARVKALDGLGSSARTAEDRLAGLRAEARARLNSASAPPPAGQVPRYLLSLAPTQANAIVIDAQRSRAYVFESATAGPRLVANVYVSLGKRGLDKLREGDQKTPIGVYHVTASIAGSRLPDLYGWGAFPLNYPNAWDRRAGKTGHGIWLHGVPSDSYARAPRASDGCIALANDDISALASRVRPGATPVLVAERIEWVTPQALRAERDALLGALERWRLDWERGTPRPYLAHYARAFRAGRLDLAAWSAYKRRVNASKTWISVRIESVSILRSPARDGAVEVTFEQDYRSSNLSQRTRKRQYWIEEDGRWKIAYEGLVSGGKVVPPQSYAGALAASRR